MYYDGISFDRKAMRRVRKALNKAAKVIGSEFAPLIDIHTGEVADAASACRYLGHFAYADSAWNGEGARNTVFLLLLLLVSRSVRSHCV